MRTWLRTVGTLAAALLLFVLVWQAAAIFGQEAPGGRGGAPVPGDSRRGAQLFREQRCVECHSFHGVGGASAPDLGRRSAREYTPDMLAAVIWNHAPVMFEAMGRKGLPVPALDERAVADLFAHFYSLRYFATPGDAARGKELFAQKRCGHCHALRAGEKSIGPAVATWQAVSDPSNWIREMWNHSAAMAERMRQERISWPRLSEQDLSDLVVYLQNLPETRSQKAQFAPANPQEGRAMFEQKNCAGCHTLGERAAGKVNLLEQRRASGSWVAFAAEMWNHAPQMRKAAKAGAAPPTFSGAEMNHLVAYLFWTRFFHPKGDAGRGRRIYQAKGCAGCHDVQGSGAPSLAQFSAQVSPIFMTSALWKHGPKMMEAMRRQSRTWPQFTGAQMADLIAFLNRPR